MGPSVGNRPGFQFGLGQWMLLNLYLAIILASAALVMRVEGRGMFLLALISVTVGVPWILFSLTMALRRPSPRRDMLAIVFLEVYCFTIFGWMALGFGLLEYDRRNLGSLGPGWIPSRSLTFWFVLILSGLGLLSQFIVVPGRRCPRCRRWLLIRQQAEPTTTKQRVLMFEFTWCVGCGARWKHNRDCPDWVDASDPAYDEWFGLGPRVTARRRLTKAIRIGRRY